MAITNEAYQVMMKRDRTLASRIRRRKNIRRNIGKRCSGYEAYLIRTYGLDLRDVRALWVDQDSLCPCCALEIPEPSSLTGRVIHVDHDHKTGRVRGVLCARCNIAIGQVQDSVETLKRMIAYLERTS